MSERLKYTGKDYKKTNEFNTRINIFYWRVHAFIKIMCHPVFIRFTLYKTTKLYGFYRILSSL